MKFWKVVGLIAFVIAVIVGVEFLLSLPLALWAPKEALESPIVNTLYSIFSYLLAILFIIYLPPKISKKIKPSSHESLGLKGLPTWTDIGLAPVGYVICILMAMGIGALFELLPWFDANQAQELGYSPYMMGAERAIAFILLAVIAPIAEEIVFRGFLYGKLRIMVPKWLAIILTSLAFGLIHFQWNVGISVFCMSVVTCILREITGTIYAGMLVHIINNGVAFYLVYVAGL